MSSRSTNMIAGGLLAIMFTMAVSSMAGDSGTMDEVAHLPAGYSYLTQQDMRLNPEHPPLMKDLAGFPLLFIRDITFPAAIKEWQEDVNGQWGFGFHFLYKAGNPADRMLFWGRVPMILLLLLLGFYVFRWARTLFGNRPALLALFFFAFSPTLLAHGRLVTTDVAAALGFFGGSYYFVRALQDPTRKNIIFAGLAFGVAELLKFSVILLVPFFIFLALIWWRVRKISFLAMITMLVSIFVIGFVLIWLVYLFHTWNYPPERQVSDTEFLLTSFKYRPLADVVIWLADKPGLKAIGQYLLGLFMVLERAAGGHTTYFWGEVGAAGWKNYFPIVYAIKVPLAFHILTLIALVFALLQIRRPVWRQPLSRLKRWIGANFAEAAMLSFIALYWATSLASNLNIGVRHLLPVFPFTMILVAREIGKLTEQSKRFLPLILALLLWQAGTVIAVYPHFLASFNELVGGPSKGYTYTVNSNLDWGQDLKRLAKWAEENKIDRLYVDYFGGGDAQYYLGEKFLPWQGTRKAAEFPRGSYLAVSATFLQGGRGKPIPGFDQPSGYYKWLDPYTPITTIGHSIFVYYIE